MGDGQRNAAGGFWRGGKTVGVNWGEPAAYERQGMKESGGKASEKGKRRATGTHEKWGKERRCRTDKRPLSAFIRYRVGRSGTSQRLPTLRIHVSVAPSPRSQSLFFMSDPDHPIIFSSPPPMSDPRFARLKTDPRFRKIKKNDHKVAVDERFKSLFQDDNKSGKRKSKGPARPFSVAGAI